MKTGRTVLMAFALAAAAAGGLYWHARQAQAAPAAASEDGQADASVVAQVRVEPLTIQTVRDTLTVLGTVEAAPGETQALSVPFESRVSHVQVVTGQSVDSDEPLMAVEPSPDARLQIEQARQERDSAENQLALARQRAEMKLATHQEVLQAQQALQAADLRVVSLEKRGIDGRRVLQAAAAGIVSRIDVQAGQTVPPGDPLLETIAEGRISVRLGVESVDAARVQPGMDVSIRPVNDPQAAFAGRVRRVARDVNPETRLVSVFVAPDSGARLLLNQYVRGVIQVASRQALVAPPAAVLPTDGADVLYTVEDGRAVRHEVKVGLRNDRQVELVDSDLEAGQRAVVVGGSELADGMAVKLGAGT